MKRLHSFFFVIIQMMGYRVARIYHKASAVEKKQLFDSRSVARGLGLAKYCFCVLGFFFFLYYLSAGRYHRGFYTLAPNELRYEKLPNFVRLRIARRQRRSECENPEFAGVRQFFMTAC